MKIRLQCQKNVYIDQLHDISNTVRISKYKNIFEKGHTPNWYEEIFLIKKVKNAVSRICVVRDFDEGKAFGKFYKRKLQRKKNQKEFRVEKVIKRTEQKLYFK